MTTHDCPVVHCQAMHQTRCRMGSRAIQLTYICSKACSWRDADFVYRNAVYEES